MKRTNHLLRRLIWKERDLRQAQFFALDTTIDENFDINIVDYVNSPGVLARQAVSR